MAHARSLFKRLGPVGPVALISMTLPGILGIVLLWLSVQYAPAVRPWVFEHWYLSLALYVAAFSILAGLPILPTYSLSVLGGYLFFRLYGTAGSLAGYMGAAMVSYIFLRSISGDRVEKVLAEHRKWKAIRDELLVRSPWRTLVLVALLRVPPNLPFAVVNLVLVTSRVPPPLYFAGTLLGVIPRTVAVVWIAATTARLDVGEGKWFYIAGIGVTIGVLIIISTMAQRAIRQITERSPDGALPVVKEDGRPQ